MAKRKVQTMNRIRASKGPLPSFNRMQRMSSQKKWLSHPYNPESEDARGRMVERRGATDGGTDG